MFDKQLKEVEANTYWKIKDYEKLLEARPTMQYVKSAVQDEGRNIFIKSRVYTDECIEKLKSKEDAYNKMLEAFKIETNLSLKEFGDKLKETDRSIVDRDLAVRDHVRDIEKALLTKIDEIHFKAEKMQE